MFPSGTLTPTAGSNRRILLTRGEKHNECPRARTNRLAVVECGGLAAALTVLDLDSASHSTLEPVAQLPGSSRPPFGPEAFALHDNYVLSAPTDRNKHTIRLPFFLTNCPVSHTVRSG